MASSKPAIPPKDKVERVLWANDVHFPYHDPIALALWEDFSVWYRPHVIYLNGDILDAQALSKHPKTADKVLLLQKEIAMAAEWMARVRKMHPKARIVFRAGNHEHRLERFILEHPQVSSLDALTWTHLLRLKESRIDYVGYMDDLDHRGFLVEHGNLVSPTSGYTAAAMLRKRGKSGISGHVHRLAAHYHTNADGMKAWFEAGCLCTLRPDYIMGPPNWQQGFAIGEWRLDSKRWKVELVPIIDHTIQFAGRYWVGAKPRKKAG